MVGNLNGAGPEDLFALHAPVEGGQDAAPPRAVGSIAALDVAPKDDP
jgi:hypothetical protein